MNTRHDDIDAARQRLLELAADGTRAQRLALIGVVLPLALGVFAVFYLVSARAALVVAWPAMGAAALLVPRVRHRWCTAVATLADTLDRRFSALEDSTQLLAARFDQSGPVTGWQRERAAAALMTLDNAGELQRVLPRFPWTLTLASVVLSAGLFAGCAAVPVSSSAQSDSSDPALRARATTADVLRAAVQITPPAYLEQPPSRQAALNVTAPAFSRLRWQLVLNRNAAEVSLVFNDGQTLNLEARGNRRWQSPLWPARDAVYDVVIDGFAQPDAHRIEITPDRAPTVRVELPQNPIIVDGGADNAASIAVPIRAEDDHQLTAIRAVATLASGRGEQVRFRERATTLVRPEGAQAELVHSVVLAALEMTPGDELYLVIEAVDNAPDGGQVGQSATLIVRWPGEDARASTVEATTAVPVLPTYFRSQRQIIIDTEALIAQRAIRVDSRWRDRAQSLAADQKALRLRYGQYLGEEAESGIGEGLMPELDSAHDDSAHVAHESNFGLNFGPSFGVDLKPNRNTAHAHDSNAQSAAAPSHDHPGHTPQNTLGGDDDASGAQAAMAPFTHFHDRAEQSTLFDPGTTRTLKRALAAMWDAELALRMGEPERALPFEYDALAALKIVQQSDRIYLKRSGFRPTPIDEQRRFSGEMDEVAEHANANALTDSADQALRTVLDAMTGVPDSVRVDAHIDAALNGVREAARRDPAALDLLAALESWHRDRRCTRCRDRVMRTAWTHLSARPPGPARRTSDGSPVAKAYRQRLGDARKDSP